MAENKHGKKNDFATFCIDFLMGGVSAAVSKTRASPIEVIKLRLQNVEAMLRPAPSRSLMPASWIAARPSSLMRA